MRNEHDDAPMFLNHCQILFRIPILHTTGKIFERHTHHLNLFHHVIADVVVELALNPAQFSLRLLGKRVAQIPADYLPAIMHDVAHQEAKPVGQDIKCPERKQSHEPHARVGQPIDKFRFHTSYTYLYRGYRKII